MAEIVSFSDRVSSKSVTNVNFGDACRAEAILGLSPAVIGLRLPETAKISSAQLVQERMPH